MTAAPADRRADLARIHILAKECRLPRDEYEDLLFALARVRSSGDLDQGGRAKVIAHLSKLAAKYKKPAAPRAPNEWAFIDRAAPERKAMLRKICAMCRAERRSKKYADGVAERMFGLSTLEFAGPSELHKIVSALMFDQRRRAAKGAP